MAAGSSTSVEGARLKHAVLVGAGRMGSAMARGWIQDLGAAGVGRLSVVESAPTEDVTDAADDKLIVLNPPPEPADILVLAIKPQSFARAVDDLKAWVSPQTLVVSIMAGVTIARISSALGCEKVARAMPNLSLIHICCLCGMFSAQATSMMPVMLRPQSRSPAFTEWRCEK